MHVLTGTISASNGTNCILKFSPDFKCILKLLVDRLDQACMRQTCLIMAALCQSCLHATHMLPLVWHLQPCRLSHVLQEEASQQHASNSAHPMEGLAGEAPLLCSLLRELATRLQVPAAAKSTSAVELVDGILHQLSGVMRNLPQSFFGPLLPEGQLSQQQVCTLLSC